LTLVYPHLQYQVRLDEVQRVAVICGQSHLEAWRFKAQDEAFHCLFEDLSADFGGET
jgi:hypothetical protein